METNSNSGSIPKATALTMEYVLTRIDHIIMDNDYIHAALDAIAHGGNGQGGNHVAVSDGEGMRFAAVGETVAAREETNRAALALLERMYGDLRPASSSPAAPTSVERFERIMKAIDGWDLDEDALMEMAKSALELRD